MRECHSRERSKSKKINKKINPNKKHHQNPPTTWKIQKAWSSSLVFVESRTGETTKPWVSSTDVTEDSDWEEGKPTLLKLKNMSHGQGCRSSSRRKQRVPRNAIRPLCPCIPRNTWVPPAFKLSPLAPTRGVELRRAWRGAVRRLRLSWDRRALCCV